MGNSSIFKSLRAPLDWLQVHFKALEVDLRQRRGRFAAQRHPVVAARLKGSTLREIASRTGVPLSTIASQAESAIAELVGYCAAQADASTPRNPALESLAFERYCEHGDIARAALAMKVSREKLLALLHNFLANSHFDLYLVNDGNYDAETNKRGGPNLARMVDREPNEAHHISEVIVSHAEDGGDTNISTRPNDSRFHGAGREPYITSSDAALERQLRKLIAEHERAPRGSDAKPDDDLKPAIPRTLRK